MQRLPREAWLPLATAHAARVDELTAQAVERKRRGIKHPTEDFLWHYYFLRPTQLRRWHPGLSVALENAPEYQDIRGYTVDDDDTAVVDAEFIDAHRSSWQPIAELLSAVSGREPRFGCSALHEWAMVYGLAQNEVRHEQLPLRLSPAEIAEVVESGLLRCTHYDAFRFYTIGARPLNPWQLTRESQVEFEQGACLHANMDLYKWAYKLLPAVSSELLLDCFNLAKQARTLDMQASPYECRDFGIEPIAVETPEGREAFATRQRVIASEAVVLRERLLAVVNRVLEPVS